jgi:hypothetical protein
MVVTIVKPIRIRFGRSGCLLRNFDLPDGIKDIAKQLFLLRDSPDRNK